MSTTLTIAGTDYDGAARAAASILMPSLKLLLDGYDSFEFSEVGCGPVPTFLEGQAVTVTIDGTVAFRGEISSCTLAREQTWTFTYGCLDLKGLADTVPVRSRAGRGEAVFNLPQNDPDFIRSLSGLTLGGIVTKVLCVPATAQALNAYGIGGYTGLPSNPALPPDTAADLALLNIVPSRPVSLAGEVHNAVRQVIGEWMPRFVPWIDPATGRWRFLDVNAMPVTRTITIQGDSGDGDLAEPPQITRDTGRCFTAVQTTGRNVQPTVLSTKDGTLAPAWTPAQEAAWRYSDFAAPRDASDEGTIVSITPTSVTIKSNDATRNWADAFWPGRQGNIFLFNDAGGIVFSSTRFITSSTAMAAGGTATITWDATIPLDSISYTRYRITGQVGPLSLVGRKYLVREKSTGKVGLESPVGAALEPSVFPQPITMPIGSAVGTYSSATAIISWSIDGTATAFNSISLACSVDPESGSIILAEPAAKVSSSPDQLARGYPGTYQSGKPVDVAVILLYNQGQLTARYPATGYAGRAFTLNGIQRVLTLPNDDWKWVGYLPTLLQLVQEHHAITCDPVESGSIVWHGMPTAWPAATLGYSLAFAMSDGSPNPWTGRAYPVRSVTIAWPNDGPDLVVTTLGFSNQRRQTRGDQLLMPRRYSGGGFGGYGDDGYFLDQPAYIGGPNLLALDGPAAGLLAINGPSGTGEIGDWGDGSEFGPQPTGDWGGNPVEPIGDWGNDTFGGFGVTAADDGGAARWADKVRDRKAERERREVDISPDPNRDPFEPTRPEIIPPPPVPLSDRRDRNRRREDEEA